MTRHLGAARFRGLTAVNAAQVRSEGRKLLGSLMERLALGGIRVGKVERVLPDGTRLIAQYDGSMPIVTAIAPTAAARRADEPTFELWVPQGFVIYPASDAAPAGWGAPVVQRTGSGLTPYSSENLAPGLDTARWTVGGALGQVLLTRVSKAGYPEGKATAIAAPLLYDRTYGPAPDKRSSLPLPDAQWQAFRMEFVAFTAQSPATTSEQGGIVAAKRTVFEMTNAHRQSIGRDPFLLPVRGFFDSAQISAEIMFSTHTLGHMSERYPVNWRTSDERAAHDGIGTLVRAADADSRSHNTMENALANYFPPAPTIGVDSNGVPIQDILHPGPAVDGAAAVASWLASPGHRAAIESTNWDGHSTSSCVGVRAHFATQHFLRRDMWIACGNRFWTSKHAEVPTLSWFGFASLNLEWETWPCQYNFTLCPAPEHDPLTELGNFVAADGQCQWWLYYTQPAAGQAKAHAVPALSSSIFMRGRCIAIAPHGGLVWAAAIQKFDSPDADRLNVYRLVALVHHPDDQPHDKMWGQTPYLRVWYCDLPADSVIAANPPATIRGVYGQETNPPTWPWDIHDNPWSWRGGDRVDVGTTNGSRRDLLKYAAQWVFAPDGMAAICLRDTGTYRDYFDQVWPKDVGGTPRCWEVADGVYLTLSGLAPSALELQFGGNAFNPLTVTPHWLGPCMTSTAPIERTLDDIYPGITGGEPVNQARYDVYAMPIAAGYDAQGERRFAKRVVAMPQTNRYDNRDEFSGVMFGGYAEHIDAGEFSGFIGTDCGREALPAWYATYLVQDVRDGAFIAAGRRAFWSLQRASSGALFAAYTHWLTTNWFGSGETYCNVRAYRGGALLHEQTFTNPDGAVMDMGQVCYTTTPVTPGGGETYTLAGIILPLSRAHAVVPSYAANRDGEYLSGYLFHPQPFVWFASGAPACACAREVLDLSLPDYSCKPHVTDLGTAAFGAQQCRGGWFGGSPGTREELAALAHIDGENPRTLYARCV